MLTGLLLVVLLKVIIKHHFGIVIKLLIHTPHPNATTSGNKIFDLDFHTFLSLTLP